jgi:hypothetical protein
MPRLADLFPTFEPQIRGLNGHETIRLADVQTNLFELERHGELAIYYAPVDWLWPTARIAVVGITPSAGTMLRAHQVAARTLAAGGGLRAALQAVKREAPFSGFRSRVIARLDALGVARHLEISTCAALFEPSHARLLHATAVVRYPAFYRNKNYSGSSPSLLSRRTILRRYVYDVLAPELARIPDALVVPLGDRVDEAVAALAEANLIDPNRCLVGFPHPSGLNVGGDAKWEAGRASLKRKVTRWFRAHPVAHQE